MLRKIIKPVILSAIFIGLVVSSLISFRLLFLYNETKTIDLTHINLYETTKIYDANEELITTLGVEQRELVTYDEISPNMINALISIEDNHFFEHDGIDKKRIVAAFWENIRTKSFKEGASTITQQLIKLEFLTSDKTIDRKIKEAFLSMRLEEIYSKEEILELYLNRVLFGGRIYGVENASNYYFDKSAHDLNFEESALLAGIIQSPNWYNPYTNEEATKNRQIQVLNQMFNNQYITEEEYDAAVARPLSELVIEQKIKEEERQPYHEYIDYVIHEITNEYGLDPFQDSLTVYTNLDRNAQDYVMELEQNNELYKDEKLQTGMVIIETKTGKIRAIGGGRNYHSSMQFNFATDALIQPGSTIKPLLDYGPAFEYLNYSPGTPLVDEKIYYSTLGSRYMPIQNYDHRYKGTLTLREALIDSRNVTAIKVFREVGSEKAYEFASKLGLEFNDLQTEANAIGGFERGFNVLSITGAYSSFGNKGYYHKPSTIGQIYHEGRDITKKNEAEQVMKEETAYLMTDILHDNMITGTAYRANVANQYVAGKTGQTNYDSRTQSKYGFPSNAVRDSWFIGYSSEYTTGVWVGYESMGEDLYLTPNEAKLSLDLFKKVMSHIHVDLETAPYERPENIVEMEVEVGTTPAMRPSIHTPQAFRQRELFIKGSEPTEISTKFSPLEAPKDLFVYYDDSTQKVNISWNKSIFDYGTNEYNHLSNIHTINKFYDQTKDSLLYEYYNDRQSYPSYTRNDAMKSKIKAYCQINGEENTLCQNLSNLTYQQHITLLEQLNEYEKNKILTEQNHLRLLSEAEIADIKNVQNKLGKIEYTITFHNGLYENVVYRGPYQGHIEVSMPLDAFMQYSSFSIQADFSNYRYRLTSNEEMVLNPFYNIF
jgi:penicillin-binding protein 1A